MSKDALSLAREFVATVDRLATVPGMLASYDLGKLAICRGLIEAHAHIAVVTAQRDELMREAVRYATRMQDEKPTVRHCAKCGKAENAHNVRHPFVAMGGTP